MIIQFFTLYDVKKPIRSVDFPFRGNALQDITFFQNWVNLDLSFALAAEDTELMDKWYLDDEGDRIRLDTPDSFAEAYHLGTEKGTLAILVRGEEGRPADVPLNPPSWLQDAMSQLKTELRQELLAPGGQTEPTPKVREPAVSSSRRLESAIRSGDIRVGGSGGVRPKTKTDREQVKQAIRDAKDNYKNMKDEAKRLTKEEGKKQVKEDAKKALKAAKYEAKKKPACVHRADGGRRCCHCAQRYCNAWHFSCLDKDCPLSGTCGSTKAHKLAGLEHAVLAIPAAAWAANPVESAHLPPVPAPRATKKGEEVGVQAVCSSPDSPEVSMSLGTAATEVEDFARQMEAFQARASLLDQTHSFALVSALPTTEELQTKSDQSETQADEKQTKQDDPPSAHSFQSVTAEDVEMVKTPEEEATEKTGDYEMKVIEEGEAQLMSSLNLATHAYSKRWTVQNSGSKGWGPETVELSLAFASGGVTTLSGEGVPRLDPGQVGDLVLWLYAPVEAEEERRGVWELLLKSESRRRLGPQLIVDWPYVPPSSEELWSVPPENEAERQSQDENDSAGDDFSLVAEELSDSDSDDGSYELVQTPPDLEEADETKSEPASDIQSIRSSVITSPSEEVVGAVPHQLPEQPIEAEPVGQESWQPIQEPGNEMRDPAEEDLYGDAAEELSIVQVDPHNMSIYTSTVAPSEPESWLHAPTRTPPVSRADSPSRENEATVQAEAKRTEEVGATAVPQKPEEKMEIEEKAATASSEPPSPGMSPQPVPFPSSASKEALAAVVGGALRVASSAVDVAGRVLHNTSDALRHQQRRFTPPAANWTPPSGWVPQSTQTWEPPAPWSPTETHNTADTPNATAQGHQASQEAAVGGSDSLVYAMDQLVSMGFTDVEKNMALLRIHGENLDSVVDTLLTDFNIVNSTV